MSINKKDLVAVRPGTEEDYPFVFSTWLRGLRFGNDWFELIESGAYYQNYHKSIESILNNPKTQLKIACLKDDPEVILGYSVHHDDTLHWVHVKSAWRSIGIARGLVPKDLKVVTHLTKVGKSIYTKKPGVVFNPFNTP